MSVVHLSASQTVAHGIVLSHHGLSTGVPKGCKGSDGVASLTLSNAQVRYPDKHLRIENCAKMEKKLISASGVH